MATRKSPSAGISAATAAQSPDASGTTTDAAVNRWHLCYAFVDLRVTGARLFGNSNLSGSTTVCSISVAPTQDLAADFPNATTLFSAPVTFTSNAATEMSFATPAAVPAGRYFYVAVAGGTVARSRIDDAPSRIAVNAGSSFAGVATGYWESDAFVTDATTLNSFTAANRTRATSMDRIGWRMDLPAA